MSGSRNVRSWIVLADALRAAGLDDDPAVHAEMLREAGVDVTRNSRAQWVASPHDRRTAVWLYSLAGVAAASRASAP